MPCVTTASLPVLGSRLQLASVRLSLGLPLPVHSYRVWAYVAYEIACGSLLLPVLSFHSLAQPGHGPGGSVDFRSLGAHGLVGMGEK